MNLKAHIDPKVLETIDQGDIPTQEDDVREDEPNASAIDSTRQIEKLYDIQRKQDGDYSRSDGY
jgi:hypothetical protein